MATAFNVEAITSKVGKTLFGVYKSASGILKANSDVSSGTGDAAFGARLKAVNARGVDRILTNAGDAILRRFGVATQLADFLCEKIMQHLLSVRALISPEDSRTLIVYQAADEPAARGQLLKRLAASGMTITSGLIDIASAPVKEELRQLGDKGAASWSMQRLKLAGGLLSVAATGIGVIWDGVSMRESDAKDRRTLVILYAVKTLVGVVSLSLSLASTFTHAAPLLAKLSRRQALQGAAEAAGTRAGAIIGARILFMSVGAWLSVVSFGIQLFIWVQPDDLQLWCKHCAFGTDRKNGWTPTQQFDELEKSLKAIGIA